MHIFICEKIKKFLIQFRNSPLDKILTNALRLIIGNAAQSIFGMLAVFIAARALQVERFGQLILISYWSYIVLQLFNFQTSHAIVKEGTVSFENNNFSAFWGVIKFGLILDVVTAIIASIIFAIGVLLTSHFVQLESTVIFLLYLYILTMITSVVGTPTALFRLFNQYNFYVVYGSISGLCKFLFTLIAWTIGNDILYFGIAWILAQVVSNIMFCTMAIREYWKQSKVYVSQHPILKFGEVVSYFPELPSRIFSTHLSGVLKMARELDVLIIGIVLGSAAAGLFKIARQFGTAFMKIIDPIFQVIYPDMASLEERKGRGEVIKLIRYSSIMVGSCSLIGLLIFVMLGRTFIEITLGAEFDASVTASICCVAGTAIWGFTHSYGAALLVWNRHRILLTLNIVSSIIYLGSIYLMILNWGVTGAGIATIFYYAFWGLMAAYIVRQESKNF